jgi:hypothetical protein
VPCQNERKGRETHFEGAMCCGMRRVVGCGACECGATSIEELNAADFLTLF